MDCGQHLIALTQLEYDSEELEVESGVSAILEATRTQAGWRMNLILRSTKRNLQVKSLVILPFEGSLPTGGKITLANGVDDVVGVVVLNDQALPFIFSILELQGMVRSKFEEPWSDHRPKLPYSRRHNSPGAIDST